MKNQTAETGQEAAPSKRGDYVARDWDPALPLSTLASMVADDLRPLGIAPIDGRLLSAIRGLEGSDLEALREEVGVRLMGAVEPDWQTEPDWLYANPRAFLEKLAGRDGMANGRSICARLDDLAGVDRFAALADLAGSVWAELECLERLELFAAAAFKGQGDGLAFRGGNAETQLAKLTGSIRNLAGVLVSMYDHAAEIPVLVDGAAELFTMPLWRWRAGFGYDPHIRQWVQRLSRAAVQSRLASSPADNDSEVWVRSDEASVAFEKHADTISKAAKRLGWKIEKAGSMNAYRLSDLESYFRKSLRKSKN